MLLSDLYQLVAVQPVSQTRLFLRLFLSWSFGLLVFSPRPRRVPPSSREMQKVQIREAVEIRIE